MQKEIVYILPPSCELKARSLMRDGKSCVPPRNVRDILFMAHDSKIGGHVSAFKTPSRPDAHRWKHMSRDVCMYCKGCGVCQHKSDGRTKNSLASYAY